MNMQVLCTILRKNHEGPPLNLSVGFKLIEWNGMSENTQIHTS